MRETNIKNFYNIIISSPLCPYIRIVLFELSFFLWRNFFHQSFHSAHKLNEFNPISKSWTISKWCLWVSFRAVVVVRPYFVMTRMKKWKRKTKEVLYSVEMKEQPNYMKWMAKKCKVMIFCFASFLILILSPQPANSNYHKNRYWWSW